MSATDQSIESTLANDPEMLEIIELFVDQMPARMAALSEAWSARDHDKLAMCAHRLKGACAGYGYATVGDAAAALEAALNGVEDLKDDAIGDRVEDLIDLCRRMVVMIEQP